VHPRIIADGFEIAKNFVLPFLESFKVPKPGVWQDRELLACVARSSLRTKLLPELADQLTDIVTDAVLIVRKEGEPIDLHMVRAREEDGERRLAREGGVQWRPAREEHWWAAAAPTSLAVGVCVFVALTGACACFDVASGMGWEICESGRTNRRGTRLACSVRWPATLSACCACFSTFKFKHFDWSYTQQTHNGGIMLLC